ncbi:MAG TPA: GtrA family protein [Terracidiphilus sp.]
MTEHLRELLPFGTIGAGCFALGLAVLVGLHDLAGVNYLVAYGASFFAANTAGYLLNARFTFAATDVDQAGVARYMLVNATLLCVNTAGLKLLVDGAHIWYVAAALLLAAGSAPVGFLAHRWITYRLRGSAPRPGPFTRARFGRAPAPRTPWSC